MFVLREVVIIKSTLVRKMILHNLEGSFKVFKELPKIFTDKDLSKSLK